MMAQIKRIGVKQTAKVVAIFYFVITLIIFLPIFVISLLFGGLSGDDTFGKLGAIFGGVIFLVLPFFYAVIGGLMVAISAALYNFVAKKVGGIEVEIENNEVDQVAQSQKIENPESPTTGKAPWRS
jgi:hypothetical protein